MPSSASAIRAAPDDGDAARQAHARHLELDDRLRQ